MKRPRGDSVAEEAECAGCGETRRIVQAELCVECMERSLLGGGSFL